MAKTTKSPSVVKKHINKDGTIKGGMSKEDNESYLKLLNVLFPDKDKRHSQST